jgi:hypothetical protein
MDEVIGLVQVCPHHAAAVVELVLGAVAQPHGGAELLFQVFADRYERASLLVTGNLPFSDRRQVFQGERMTAALLDRLTHRCHISEMNGENYRFRESVKASKKEKGRWSLPATRWASR